MSGCSYSLPMTFNVYFSDSTLMYKITIFDLITAHAPISAQSSNYVVFRLQPVYFLSTSL